MAANTVDQDGILIHPFTDDELLAADALRAESDLLYFNNHIMRFGREIADGSLFQIPATQVGPICEWIGAGKHALLDIDVQGAQKLKDRGLDPLMIFLRPPDWDELLRRLQNRADTPPEVIQRRLETAQQEVAQKWRYDLRPVNDDLDRCMDEIRAFVEERAAKSS